ncbi:MAG: type VII secretion protein EssC [Ardenticatenia bacterium]|nr:type VII secretion protein EssC [Ardenticatenia bacterium]
MKPTYQFPTFARSPRLRARLSLGTFEVHDPPKAPNKPQFQNMLASAIPIGVTVLVMVVVGLVFGMGSFLLFSVPMMLATIGGTWYVYRLQQREYERAIREREYVYTGYLRQKADELNKMVRHAADVWQRQHPRPEECFEIVAFRKRDLWARRPEDDDFLAVRVGLCSRPLPVEFKLPEIKPFEPDPLVEQAHALVSQYATVDQVPAWLDIRRGEVIGLAGPRDGVMNLIRAIVLHVATHHAPSEAKIGALFAKQSYGDWAWMRWLPHTWDDRREHRFLARIDQTDVEGQSDLTGPSQESQKFLNRIEALLSERERWQREQRKEDVAWSPILLFFDVEHPDTVSPIVTRLMEEGPQYGIYPFFIAPRVKLLPHVCQLIVRVPYVNEREPAAFWLVNERPTRFTPDHVSLEFAETFARTMAPIRQHQGVEEAHIPSLVTLFELLNIHDLDEWPLQEMWQRTWQRSPDDPRVPRHLATPLGIAAGNEPLVIDLHERQHGPNGLVAGMVGAGKSELLQTLVISMALHYHPHRLAFVLIDYKGGGMADPLKGLPHVIGVITNLQEGNLAVRAITSLNVELRQRQELFHAAGVNHIDDYQRLYNEGKVETPLPYLVVIVDEFAEMKTERPEVAQEFVRIARLGRALGFRLILAMQKPAGIVDGQIEANTRFRLCLRVAQTEDSQAMLKRPDAAYLQHIGRAIFQVGVNEIFETFQVAWSGAPATGIDDPTTHPLSITHVQLDGSRQLLYLPSHLRRRTGLDEVTQLEAAVAFIAREAQRLDIDPLPALWLDPLPARISLDQVRPDGMGWDGHTWRPVNRWLEPIVGLMDIPDRRAQLPLGLPLGTRGHTLLCSAPGYGKTTFVQTLVASLALDHSPGEVNMYVIDFGGRALGMLESFPHVGSVIYGDDDERVRRLVRRLTHELNRRQQKLGEIGAPSLRHYVHQTGEPMPAIVVIIDNFTGFNEAYQEDERFMEQVQELVREGRGAGIYFVFTTNSAMEMRYKMRSNIGVNVAFYLADHSEYGSLLRDTSVVPPQVRGRGVMDGPACYEFQTTLPVWQFHTASTPSTAEPVSSSADHTPVHGESPSEDRVSQALRQ